MKHINNSIIKKLSILLIIASVFGGCKKDFFDLADPNGINSEIWDDEGAVNLFLNRGYDLVIPTWPVPGAIHNTSDELNNANTTLLYGTLVENSITDIGSSNSITASRYFDIRRCNTAIEGINAGKLPDNVKKLYKGQFFFLRAFVYFRLVSLYGGVPLLLKAQALNGDVLDIPRSKTSECIEAIVNDLDSAGAYLPGSWAASDLGRVTKGAALALKGKVLMYWASPQFNPSNSAERWDRAYNANKQAYDTCVANGYILFPNYSNIFVTEDNKEVLIVRKHDAISLSPGRGTNTEYLTRPRSETTALGGGGSNQPTWNLVQAYTMNNGLPITNAASGYSATQFWQNRDPRFEASISYNGGLWPLSGKTTRKQWAYAGALDEPSASVVTGFYCKKICNASLPASQSQYNSNSGGGSGMDWVEMRFAEVVMNLAECANETGRMAEAKDMVRKIRTRAGIVVGTFDYGLSVATNLAEMRDLILNERMVEFAMEGKRYFDLRRTRRLHLLTGTVRQRINWTPKAPYYAGTGSTAGRIYLDKPDASGILPRDTANLNNPVVYAAMFTVSLTSLDAAQPINIPMNYYFYPLPTFLTQSSPLIQQTQGWAGGTFDPLQ